MSRLDALKRLFHSGPSESGADHAHPDGLSCEDALRLVHDFLDGELEGTPSADVKAHFEKCQRCYPFLRLEESFRLALRKAARGESTPPDLRERVLSVLEEAAADH